MGRDSGAKLAPFSYPNLALFSDPTWLHFPIQLGAKGKRETGRKKGDSSAWTEIDQFTQ